MKLSCLTDSEIWLSFKKGEEWAVSYIYKEYSPKLYQYGVKFTVNVPLVEDTIQDLFTELIKNHKTIGETNNILFYLLKSFRRKLFRKMESEKKYSNGTEPEEYQFEVVWSIEHDLIIEEEANQKKTSLLKALDKLTPRQKEAIYLHFTKELDYCSIAEIMNISIESCRNLISKAIFNIKKGKREKIKFAINIFYLSPNGRNISEVVFDAILLSVIM